MLLFATAQKARQPAPRMTVWVLNGLTGPENLIPIKGLQKQAAGKAKVHLGDVKEAVKDAKETVKSAGGKL